MFNAGLAVAVKVPAADVELEDVTALEEPPVKVMVAPALSVNIMVAPV